MSDSALPNDAASMNANNEVSVTRIGEEESKEKDLDKNPLQGVIPPNPQFASSTVSDNHDSLNIQNYGILCQLTTAVNTTYIHVEPIQKHYASSEMYHHCSYNNKMATALISHNQKAIDVISVNANNERLPSTRGAESNSMQVGENRNVKNFFCIHLGIILICIIIVAIYFTFIFFVTC